MSQAGTDGGRESTTAAEVISGDLSNALGVESVRVEKLADPIVLRSVLAVATAALIVLWPERTDRVLVAVLGIGLIGAGVTTLLGHLRGSPRRNVMIGFSLGLVALGAILIGFPRLSIEVVGRANAIALAVYTLGDFAVTLRHRRTSLGTAWPFAKTLTLLLLAVVMFIYPGALLSLVATLVCLSVAIVGIIAVGRSVTSDGDETPASLVATGQVVVEWFARRPKPTVDRAELYDKVLYEGTRVGAKLTRFAVLMFFSGVIATGGVLTDSTAVVIGAMLIAPLMTPLMAIAISIVMGWPNRLARSALIVLGGILLVILIGIVLGEVGPVSVDATTNTQILSRSSPTILDLVIAVAAGAAGAYGLSRPDVSDALPGVAIAISLVPPLSVIGVTIAAGAYDEASGALLLFTTNALAIIIVGGATFIVTGLTPLRVAQANRQRVRTASAAVLALAVFVVAALGLNGREVASNALEAGRASEAVQRWIDGSDDFSVLSVDVTGNTVQVTIIGPPVGAPSVEGLQEGLSSALGRTVTTDLRVRVQTRDVVGPGATDG
ncbi:MAG: TIGR00341 family protein [Actinomycetota bacterium]